MQAPCLLEDGGKRPLSPLLKALRWIPKVMLGLLILAHVGFLLLHNTTTFLKSARTNKYRDWKRLRRAMGPKSFEKLNDWLDYTDNINSETQHKKLEAQMHSKPTSDVLAIRTLEATRWWEQSLRQEQGWALFAPRVADYSAFMVVELRWDHDQLPDKRVDAGVSGIPPPVRLSSENEPADVAGYFRVGQFRLRRLEGSIEIALRQHGKTWKEAAEGTGDSTGWNERIRNNYVWPKRRLIHVYLRWRTREYLRKHPQLPMPTQVRLLSRTRTILPPGGPGSHQWKLDTEIYLARWLPQGPNAMDPEHLEYYHVTSDRFQSYWK